MDDSQDTEQDFVVNFNSQLQEKGIYDSYYQQKTKELFGKAKKIYAEKQEEALIELVPSLGLDIDDETVKGLIQGKDYSEKNKAIIEHIAKLAKDKSTQIQDLKSVATTNNEWEREQEEMKKQIQGHRKTLKDIANTHQQELQTVKQDAFSRIIFDRFKTVIDTVRQNIPDTEESALEMLELQESQLPAILRDFRVEEGEVIYETSNAKGHKTTGLVFYHPDSEVPVQTSNHFYPTPEQFLKEHFLKKTVLSAIGKSEPRGGIESGQPNNHNNANVLSTSFNPADIRVLQSRSDAYDYAQKYVDGLIQKGEAKKSNREAETMKVLSKVSGEYQALTGSYLR